MRREIFHSGEIKDPEKRVLKKCASFSLDEKGASLYVKEGIEKVGDEDWKMKTWTWRGESEQ